MFAHSLSSRLNSSRLETLGFCVSLPVPGFGGRFVGTALGVDFCAAREEDAMCGELTSLCFSASCIIFRPASLARRRASAAFGSRFGVVPSDGGGREPKQHLPTNLHLQLKNRLDFSSLITSPRTNDLLMFERLFECSKSSRYCSKTAFSRFFSSSSPYKPAIYNCYLIGLTFFFFTRSMLVVYRPQLQYKAMKLPNLNGIKNERVERNTKPNSNCSPPTIAQLRYCL